MTSAIVLENIISGGSLRSRKMVEVTLTALTVLTGVVAGLFAMNPATQMYPEDVSGELYCLALNAYHEARGVNMDEMIAVSQVVMNRVEDSSGEYRTVCDVIMEGPVRESWRTRQDQTLSDEERVYFPVRGKCQFSWYCDGRSDAVRNMKGWEDAAIAAYVVYNGYGEDRVHGAMYYYAHDKISRPTWAQNMTVTAVLRGHTYLK
jgi:spore germination cell wall hydrolase CwlJ-like protein